MDKCPYCGSDKGVFTTFMGTQYYTWNGEPNGYSDNVEYESSFAKCVSCGRKVSMNRIKKVNQINKKIRI